MAAQEAFDTATPALQVDPTPRHEIQYDLEEAADSYFRAVQAGASAREHSMPSGWWVLAAVPLSLSAWVGLGVWILG